MELDAAAAVMAGLGGVAPPAVDEFRDFLQRIKEDVQVTDFIQVVGTDLLGAKVISAADFRDKQRSGYASARVSEPCIEPLFEPERSHPKSVVVVTKEDGTVNGGCTGQRTSVTMR